MEVVAAGRLMRKVYFNDLDYHFFNKPISINPMPDEIEVMS